MSQDDDPILQNHREAVKDAIMEIACRQSQITAFSLREILQEKFHFDRDEKTRLWWVVLNIERIVEELIKEGRVGGQIKHRSFGGDKIVFDVEATKRFLEDYRLRSVQNIKRSVLDLGTKFMRLQVAEIAETCRVADEALIIATVQDMIAKHQIDAQYFASTKAVAFNQQANLAARDAFIAELEAEFASWGKKEGKI